MGGGKVNSRSALISSLCVVFAAHFMRSTVAKGGSVAEWLADAEGPGFKSQSRRCRVTVLGKLFTPIVTVHQAAKLVAALLRVARLTAGLAESNGSLPPGL